MRRLEESLSLRGYESPVLTGCGAHGAVYRIRESATGRFYACKAGGEEKLWEREKTILEQISHPLFPKYRQSWQEKGTYFLIMEYVAGWTLEELLRRRGRMTQGQAVRIALSLAEGLSYLERLPDAVWFRDLKAENVRIREDGRVKLLDFGCSDREGPRDGSMAGTFGYAAPEQFAPDGKVGACSDVYSFGKLLHYMLTGDNPCLPPAQKPPIRAYDAKLDGRLEDLVEDCVLAKPQERPPDMERVLRRLRAFAGEGRRAWGNACRFPKRRRAEFLYEKNIFKTSG